MKTVLFVLLVLVVLAAASFPMGAPVEAQSARYTFSYWADWGSDITGSGTRWSPYQTRDHALSNLSKYSRGGNVHCAVHLIMNDDDEVETSYSHCTLWPNREPASG